jgi:hypothetical protein
MIVNIVFDVSVDNIEDWRGIRGKAVEVNSTRAYVTIDETAR